MQALELKLSGLVQGVGFRYRTWQHAIALGLQGWVKNNADGTVSIWAEGSRGRLRAFLDWCYTGGGLARVERIESGWRAATNSYHDFSIIG